MSSFFIDSCCFWILDVLFKRGQPFHIIVTGMEYEKAMLLRLGACLSFENQARGASFAVPQNAPGPCNQKTWLVVFMGQTFIEAPQIDHKPARYLVFQNMVRPTFSATAQRVRPSGLALFREPRSFGKTRLHQQVPNAILVAPQSGQLAELNARDDEALAGQP